ncbi:MAG: CPBP family intramembrane metalloprotease [Spirochaetales bacterium]|nr:CPBP family intramembrane metalloprotease [Spirochaetales bacterium]
MRQRKLIYFTTALVCILLFWYGTGNLAVRLLSNLLITETTAIPGEEGLSYTLRMYLVLHIGFIFLLLGILTAVRFILQISLKDFITNSPRIRFGRGAFACCLWFLLLTIFSIIEFLLYPEKLSLTLDIRSLLLFLPAACIMVSIQAGSEEMLFRAFLGRWIGRYTSGALPAAVVSGLLFTAVHLLNPEIDLFSKSAAIYLFYFLFGFILMYFSKKDGGYELAIGIHIGNNLFSSIVINYEGSVMQTPSIYTAKSDSPLPALVFLIISSLIIYLVFLHKKEDGIRKANS